MSNLKKSFLMGTVAAGAALVASAFFSILAVQAACSNPATIPTGFAAPCPVFSLSATTVTQAQTLTLSALPQPGTNYIYTTAYVSQGTAWNPYTLAGNNAYPSYSSALTSLTLSSTQLQSLSLGTHYAVVWDWLWDATANCYKGPGLNQCNTGAWRVQSFSLTSSATPTPTPTASPYTYSQSSYYAYSQAAYTNTLTFGYTAKGALVGVTFSNNPNATRFVSPSQSGTLNSISVFVASPVSASPNNLFQAAIYADNAGSPGTLIAKSVSQTITPDAWNTVPLTAAIAASTPYWLAYNANGLDGSSNNPRYDAGTAPNAWIASIPFGTWPSPYGTVSGTYTDNISIYATYTPGAYAYSQSAYYAYSQSAYYAYSQSAYYAYSQAAYTSTTINVKNSPYNAKGDGVTTDTASINSAIAALQPGYELYFPCGTYLITSQLTRITKNNVTIDGQTGCSGGRVTIKTTSAINMFVINNGGYSANTPLTAIATEGSTTFQANLSAIGAGVGDYVLLEEGIDPAHDPGIGWIGEVLKITGVSGNTATVETMVHQTYNPTTQGAWIEKILSPVTGIFMHDLTLDGGGSGLAGLAIFNTVNSTFTNITAKNLTAQGGISLQQAAIITEAGYNNSFNSIATVNVALGASGAASFTILRQGNDTVNGYSLTSPMTRAFGFTVNEAANGTYSNVTVDGTLGSTMGRPANFHSALYNTFNSLQVIHTRYAEGGMNGISIEDFSVHNTFNNCVVNPGGGGFPQIVLALFPASNDAEGQNNYNTFNNCTMTHDPGYASNMIYIGDGNNYETFSGGTYTGTNTGDNIFAMGLSTNGNNTGIYIHNATITGPAGTGILIYAGNGQVSNTCINKNTFTGSSGLGSAININYSANPTGNVGSGNTLNGLSSNLAAGTCNGGL